RRNGTPFVYHVGRTLAYYGAKGSKLRAVEGRLNQASLTCPDRAFTGDESFTEPPLCLREPDALVIVRLVIEENMPNVLRAADEVQGTRRHPETHYIAKFTAYGSDQLQ